MARKSTGDHPKKDLILAVARRHFERFGYKKTSLEDIVAEAAISKSTLYAFVANKAELLHEVVRSQMEEVTSQVEQMLASPRPADELMLEIATAVMADVEARPLLGDLLRGVYKNQIPEWAEQFEQIRQMMLVHTTRLVTLGQEQGLFRQELDPAAVAHVLQELQLLTMYSFANDREPGEAAQRLMVAADLMLNGLYAPRRKARSKPSGH